MEPPARHRGSQKLSAVSAGGGRMSARSLLEAGDHKIMRRVHVWRAPRWIRVWMLCATRGGDGWIWYGMGAVVAAYGGPERFLALGSAALAAALGIALFL